MLIAPLSPFIWLLHGYMWQGTKYWGFWGCSTSSRPSAGGQPFHSKHLQSPRVTFQILFLTPWILTLNPRLVTLYRRFSSLLAQDLSELPHFSFTTGSQFLCSLCPLLLLLLCPGREGQAFLSFPSLFWFFSPGWSRDDWLMTSTRVAIPAVLSPRCVTLGKALSLSVPQFLHRVIVSIKWSKTHQVHLEEFQAYN